MSYATPSNARRRNDLAAIHFLKSKAGMTEDEYRTMLQSVTGKTSASELDDAQRRRVFDYFSRLGVKSTARSKLDRVGGGRRRLLAKIDAQLAAADRDREYLGGMVKRIAKVDALEFCDEDALSKIVAALAIDAKRHGRFDR